MNRIYKVIYSKVRQCYVVVSEIAKSHGRHTKSSVAKSSAALTAGVLIALGSFSFEGMPVVQAADGTESLRNNDFVGANDQYWYYDEDAKEWKTYQYKLTSAFNNRARGKLPNYQGGGAKFPGAITAGLYAQAGMQTVTIGDRNAGQSKGSVFIGEHSGYNNGDNAPAGMKNNYVTSVGFQSDATGWGSIAIGSNAKAENSKMESQVVTKVGDAHTSGTVSDDTYGIEENPTIQGASVALGYNAHSKDGNIAIGSYSDATSTDKNDSYVSVGNANLKRRITNVADGASASDVATVGQLQALSDKVGVYDAGFGIEIASDKDNKTNTISLNRNLGTNYTDKAHNGDEKVTVAVNDTGLVLGGYAEDEKGKKNNPAVTYGATGEDSVTVGGKNSLASGKGSVVTGGVENIASGATAVAIGGNNNDAIGTRSAVLGGLDNTAFGDNSMVSGGSYNVAGGIQSAVLGGFSNYALGTGTTSIGGYGKDYETDYDSSVNGDYSVGVAGGSTGKNAKYALAAGHQAVVTTENGTAIGYQATTDEAKTIAFGHDAGDVSGYTIKWKQLPDGQINADNTTNDYTQAPESVTEDKYTTAAYNRLVKVADGVDDHDVVVMEQLNNAKNDLKVNAGWGINVNDVTTKNDDGTETTTKNVISLNRNLGTNYGNPWKGEGKVTFEAGGENSMILGGAASILFNNEKDDVKAGAYGKDSVLVGGFNNLIDTVANDVTQTGEDAVIVGGDTNTVTGLGSVIVGGYKNKVSGGHSIVVGGASNEADGGGAGVFGGQSNKAAGGYSSVLGGDLNEADGDWSSAIGGETNTASGLYATTLGGINNDAKGNESVVVGGVQNVAIGEDSTVNGGAENTSYGTSSYVAGGMKNMAFGNASVALGGKDSSVNGKLSTGIAGGSTGENAMLTLAAGYQSVVTDSGVEWRPITQDEEDKINQGINSWPGYSGFMDYGDGSSDSKVKVLDRISTAVGYQSTADAPGVIAFGHDKGDVASVAKKWKQKATMEVDDNYSVKYYDANHKEISADDYNKLVNSDGTLNDYTQDPIETETTYQSAYYNRLVKAADGIDAHDAVVMEQLKPYTKSDASNVGANLKTYTVGDDGETITEADATADQKKANENAWGAALGTGKVADPNATGETSAENNGSQQLVTGGTVFNETRISAKDDNGQAMTYNYLNANNSAGKNLEVLDSALKTVSTTAGAHTALTVEGNTPAGTGKDAKTNEDVYAGKNILLHESTDENGKVTYDLKLAKDINIGKPGKDGEDGKIGIDGKDGHIGLNGSDGITVRGLDGKDGTPGKDGVTITGPKGEAGKDGIDGKVGISGTDGKDAVSISGKDGVGHIGLTGPAGTNGKDGASIDITVKNGYDDAAKGIDGSKGVDGKDGITRIVYTDKTGDHQVATMEDGMKYAGDDAQTDKTKVITKKLNNTLDIIGGADSKNLTEGNIGVNSTTDGQLKVQLAKDLTDITSISNQKTEGGKTTGAKITLGDDGSVDVNGGKITHVGSGIEKDTEGNIIKTNVANIGDVQDIVNKAVNSAADTTNKALDGKANIDASNIGANLKNADGSAASAEDQKANAEKWGSAIGTGEIKADDGRMVTGKTVYNEVRPTEDGSYVKKDKTTGENLSALDTQVKNNADAIKKNSESIQNITNNVKNLSDNAVQYDNSNKTKVKLGGEGGTTITNVKDGDLSDSSKDAVNGKQLYNEQKAREAADQAITEKVTNNTNEITKIKNGEGFTDTGKTIIKNLSKDAVQVKAGDRIKVDEATDEKTGNKTYTISANNNGTVAKGDGNLISGDTLYKEVHVDKDGSYIKGSQSVGQNLSVLDSELKTTSDLIHTNTTGDTIQIGSNSTATKVDISGKDEKGNKTGRVITGVVSDANDPNSAANVGYVNGITAASNEQIYRDMNMQYNHVENDISRAAAGSNALAALHPMQEFDPDDKAQFALGYGHYRNSNAGAVGAFYQPDENSLFSFGVSFGNGDAGLNAGVTFKFGPGGSDHHALTKTQMAKVIDAQSKEIDELKKDNADKDKRIDALEQKMTEILAKLDKSKD